MLWLWMILFTKQLVSGLPVFTALGNGVQKSLLEGCNRREAKRQYGSLSEKIKR